MLLVVLPRDQQCVVRNGTSGKRKARMRLITAVLLALPLVGQSESESEQPGPWKRHVMTAKGEWFDTPAAHPLTHFTKYPKLRDESGDFCYLCTPQKRLETAKAAKGPKAEVHRVGAIGGLPIYDVFYRAEEEGAVDWKSILVRTGPNAYREIYHCQPTQVDAGALPSVIVRVGGERLLNSRYIVGGNRGLYADDYYYFGQAGPVRVDFEPVWTAGKAVLPKSMGLWRGGDENSPAALASKRFRLKVLDKGVGMCCADGIVEVRFKLDRGRVIVTDARYIANP
jgi:hypothetical protein